MQVDILIVMCGGFSSRNLVEQTNELLEKD